MLQAFSTSRPAARDLAKLTLIGRLGAQPEMRQTKNGKNFLVYVVGTENPVARPKEGGQSHPSRQSLSAGGACTHSFKSTLLTRARLHLAQMVE